VKLGGHYYRVWLAIKYFLAWASKIGSPVYNHLLIGIYDIKSFTLISDLTRIAKYWWGFNLVPFLTKASFVAFILAGSVLAGDVTIKVQDTKARGVENAVVSLKPLFESDMVFTAKNQLAMQQKGAMFAPFVLPVFKGTKVSFPNLDEFRHHVYSFSPAKRFELRLYGQDESKQIAFDTAGVVALGCNIHDNMLAYVYVTDHPIFGKTNAAGEVSFEKLPSGDYEIYVWHLDLKDKSTAKVAMITLGAGDVSKLLTLDLRNVRKKQRRPAEDDYN
jgi:plastocyanin